MNKHNRGDDTAIPSRQVPLPSKPFEIPKAGPKAECHPEGVAPKEPKFTRLTHPSSSEGRPIEVVITQRSS
jgi:hypothetical protein